MKTIALTLALCGAVTLPAPKVEPWPKFAAEGFVRQYEGLQLFGWGPKRLYLDGGVNGSHNLSFATEADYEQAERLLGQLVTTEGFVVSHGAEQRFVPVVLRERR
jgi:hypothetical protein